MDYGKILKQAYRNTLKYKSMWILALFILSSGGSGNFNIPSGDFDEWEWDNSAQEVQASGYSNSSGAERYYTGTPQFEEDFMYMLTEFWYLWAIVGVLILALVVFHFVMHHIAIAGMYYGAEQARHNKAAKFMEMVRYGAKRFWKVLGINLIVGFSAFLLVLMMFIPMIILAIIDEALAVLGLIVIIPLAILSIPVFAAVSIIMAYTMQYLVLRDKGIIDSFKLGWKTFRTNLGSSILMFVILLGLGIAFSIAFFVLFLLIIIPFAIIGFVAYSMFGWAPVIITIAIGFLLLVIAGFFFKALQTSFIYHAWHLTFVELEYVADKKEQKSVPSKKLKKAEQSVESKKNEQEKATTTK